MKELKPRAAERVLRHEPVDRVPLFYRFKHEAKEKLARIYGIEDASTGRAHNPDLELRLAMTLFCTKSGLMLTFSGLSKSESNGSIILA